MIGTVHKWALAGAAAVLVAGLVACGGDSTSGVSKEDYVKQANALCKEGADAVEALGQPDITNLAKVKQFAASAVGIIQGQIDDLQALEAPEDDKDELEKLYAEAEALLKRAAAMQQAKSASEIFDQFTNLQSGMDGINERLNEYGLTVCGQSDDGGAS